MWVSRAICNIIQGLKYREQLLLSRFKVFRDRRQRQAETRIIETSVNTAAAGLHVTSPCAICGPGFEWVSCHKGIGPVLQADTGLNTSPCLYLLWVQREKASSKVLLDKSSLCLIPGEGAEPKPELRKESPDLILILRISSLWYFELVRNRSETSERSD